MQDQQKKFEEDLLKKTDEELRTLMMQAMASEEIDVEYINCITDILAARHPEEYTFNTDGILEAALLVGEQDSAKEKSGASPAANKRRPRTLWNTLAIAAVLAIVIIAGFAIPVHGVSLFDVIARWTGELFSFSSSEIDKANQNNMITEASEDSLALYNLLLENRITVPLAPTYIPDGFTVKEITNESENGGKQKFHAVFINGTGNVISISIRESDPVDTVVEKDENIVTIYTTNQVDHYVFFNINSVSVSWCNDNYTCSIDVFSSIVTEDQIYAMIDSIYEKGE